MPRTTVVKGEVSMQDLTEVLKEKKILMGISGANAVWQSVETIGKLRDYGAAVYIVMTANAAKFVSPITFQRASNHKVELDMWDQPMAMDAAHKPLAKIIDFVLVAPATANIISKMSNGTADDMLTTTLLSIDKPIFIAPCMNPIMYKNPIIQENITRLRKYPEHFCFIEQQEQSKKGKILSPDQIVDAIAKHFITAE